MIIRTMLLVIYQKGNVENIQKLFCFFKTDPLNIFHVEISGKAANLRDNKGMRIPCLLQFIGNYKMMNILQEVVCKL